MEQPKKQWTDAISNTVLCNFYYVFFIIFAIFAAISVLGGIYIFVISKMPASQLAAVFFNMFATSKMPASQLVGVFFNIILTGGLSMISALFLSLYLICDRSLHPKYDGFQSRQFEDGPRKTDGFLDDNQEDNFLDN